MSKTWSLLVSVSLKYCAEKSLLKTYVAFFMKVTVEKKGQVRKKEEKILHHLCRPVSLDNSVNYST
jgi:hypothetical protein